MDALSHDLTTALADRYRFEGSLGAGGMAHVYLAHDIRHQRQVAIKIVRDDVAAALGRERFLQEIRTTAGLQHPHILPLLDSGEAGGRLFYVMPYVAGETLRARMDRVGAMDPADAIPLVRQIASALDHAHRKGVIHRDVKPENVLLADGLPVVADFGIALAVSQARGDRLTQTGASLGTPSYMSPEQVTGAPDLDSRTDQYSLACMLFEMLCGRPPFRGATAHATMVEHVVAVIPPVEAPRGPVPHEVAHAIRRALAKDPASRFPTVADFAAALGSGTAGATTIRVDSASIVVLPFENMSADPENAFFADGLTEEIITDLSKVQAVRVISRASAMVLKGVKRSIPSICRELNVRYALVGSVRRAGNNLRIAAQLSDSATDAQVWAEKFAGTMDDVFELQERLSREIVGALRVRLTPDDDRRLAARDITDVRVFEACTMARQEVLRVSVEGLTRARSLIEEALELFGRKAPLIAALAQIHWSYVNWGLDIDERHVDRAESLAREALALESENAAAHFTLAFIRASRGKMREGIDHALRAYAQEPANPDVLLILTALYSAIGRSDETLRYGRQAAEVDPLTPMSQWVAGWAHLMTGDLSSAQPFFEKAERLSEASPFGLFAGMNQFYLGNAERAAQHFERASHADGYFGHLARGYLHGLQRSGEPLWDLDEAMARWATTDWQYSWHLAQVYALSDRPDDAIRWLRNAVDRGLVNYPVLAYHDRFLEPLRGREEFRDLLERVKVEWNAYREEG